MTKFPGRVAHGSPRNMRKTCRMHVHASRLEDGWVHATIPEWKPDVEVKIPVTKFPQALADELERLPKRFTAYVTYRAREASEMECSDIRLAENQVAPSASR